MIATLIHYPCTVALTGLADWSAFDLELVYQSCEVTSETMGPMEGTDQMGGIGLIFSPVLVTRLLGHPGLSGLIIYETSTSTSWTHGTEGPDINWNPTQIV